ncbi:MAG: aminotransferase class I/II-fold pyridoxal phosphate-dependent enzyme [Defluviitaleaceae bacterium]|nr:aminotransferase class I/II-fold pyridoxal phosphate-dependent enzyme [Defluviitaleaceae bacterium]
MKMNDFTLELFFGKYEFTAPYLLCCSDCESMPINELLSLEPGSADKFLESWLGYSESPGDPELLLEISKTYKNIDDRGVLEFAGAQEAIFNFMNNALEPGDHMITMFPAYQSTFEICRAIGCEVSKWELTQTETGWAIDVGDLEKLVKPNTKVIAVCSPNNPTGYQLSAEENAAIAAIASKHGIMVFSDEVYRGLAENEPDSFADIYENAFSLNVMSKAYGLAGLRIGWLASQNKEFLKTMLNFKYYNSICGAVPSQKLAIIAVRNREKLFAANRRIISENLLYSDIFFKKHEGIFQYNRPMAGPIAFHRLKDRCIEDFCDELVKQKGVLLAYGTLFEKDGGYFRMGYGRKNFKICLDLLDEYVSERIAVK